MVDVLLLVPARDEHRYGDSWSTLFERLAAPLRAHGLTVEAQPWTDPVAPSQARLVMPSLAWGYHARQADWFAQLDAFEAKGVRIWLNPRDSQPWTTGAQIRKTFWLPVCTRSGVDYRKSVPGTAHLRLHPPDGRPQPLVCCRPTWPRGRGDGLSDLREVHPG